jgi:hypothetical protein
MQIRLPATKHQQVGHKTEELKDSLKNNFKVSKYILLLIFTIIVFANANAQTILPISFNSGSCQTDGKIMVSAVIGQAFVPTDISRQCDIGTSTLVILMPDGEEESSFIKIYPNPATELLFYEIVSEKIAQINLYNAAGQLILSQSRQILERGTIQLSSLKKGIYLISFVTENHKVETLKLIKN